MLCRIIKMQNKIAVNKQEWWRKTEIFEKVKTSVTSKTVPGVFPYCIYFLSGVISMQSSLREFQVPVIIFSFEAIKESFISLSSSLWSLWNRSPMSRWEDSCANTLQISINHILETDRWTSHTISLYRQYIKISLWNF